MSIRTGNPDRRPRRWRRADDDVQPAGELEGWLSELSGGETSVRRLRKRLAEMSAEVDAPDAVRIDDVPADREPAAEPAGMVG
jgi:hypothetical protein